MKLKHSKLNLAVLVKNKPLLAGLALGVVVILLALAALAMRLYYQQQMASWMQKNNSLMRSYDTELRADGGNSEALDQTLSALRSELQATQPPAKPQLFFIVLENTDEAQRREAVTEQTNKLIATTEAIQATLAYQARVSAELQKLSGQTAQDASQLKALSASWEQATATVQAVQAPAPLQEFHNKLTGYLKECAQELAALPPLFESQDRAGFLVRQDALNQKINALQGLTTELGNHLKELDNDLSGPFYKSSFTP